MSADVKKRRWGKSRPRDNITVISKADLEETLHEIGEEVKERKSRPVITLQQSNENFKAALFTGIELQQPQLMSNERLIEALTKIKVPIPVYSDGSPSRERLLYLYRTHVLPQPQRSRQQWGRRRRTRGKRKNNGGMIVVDQIRKAEEDCWGNEEDCEKMEVEVAGSDGLGGMPRKRAILSDPEDRDLVPPIKKLLIKTPSSESVPSSGTPGGMDSSPHIQQPTAIVKHKVIKVKRSSPNAPASSSRTATDRVNTNSKAPSTGRTKITWP